jgi:hypothetical protein
VPQFQASELPALGAGGEAGDPVAVDVGEPQLRAGVRAFLAGDQPHPLRPGGQVQHAGDLGDLRALADQALVVMGRCPGLLRDGQDRGADPGGDFAVTGTLFLAAAAGLARAGDPAASGRAAPALIGAAGARG